MNESCSIRFGLWKHNNWNVALLLFNLCEKVWSRTQDRTHCSVLQRRAKKWERLSSIPVTLKHLRFDPPFESCYERSLNARMSCTDNREPRKRKVCIKPSKLFLLWKFECYKWAPAGCPRVDPRNTVATTFQLPFIKTVKLLTRKNLCKAIRQRYTCHSTHLLLSFYRACREGYSEVAQGALPSTAALQLQTRQDRWQSCCRLIDWSNDTHMFVIASITKSIQPYTCTLVVTKYIPRINIKVPVSGMVWVI